MKSPEEQISDAGEHVTPVTSGEGDAATGGAIPKPTYDEALDAAADALLDALTHPTP